MSTLKIISFHSNFYINIFPLIRHSSHTKDIANEKNNYVGNYSSFINKLLNNQAIKIVCQGTSITYGQDTVSTDKRAGGSDTTLDSTTTYTTHTQANITYPEKIKALFASVRDNITIVNHGYSGDTAQSSYNRWNANYNADLTILELGINDAITGVDLSTYISYMKKIIERLISNGSSVVLLNIGDVSKSSDAKYELFRSVNRRIAKQYYIEILETFDFFKCYYANQYQSDGVHLNTTGYSIMGVKIFANLISLGRKMLTINNKDEIIFGEYLFPIMQKGCATFTNNMCKAGIGTEYGLSLAISPNGCVYIPFKTKNKDEVMTILYNVLANGNLTITLDGGLLTASQATNKYIYTTSGVKNTININASSAIVGNYSNTTYPYTNAINDSFIVHDDNVHLLTITNKGNSLAYLFDIQCTNYKDFIAQ